MRHADGTAEDDSTVIHSGSGTDALTFSYTVGQAQRPRRRGV